MLLAMIGARGMVQGQGPTLIADFLELVERDPDRTAFTWLVDGERVVEATTRGELDRAARAGASALQAAGATGEPVILIVSPGLDFIRCFLACLYAGAIAVPAMVSRRRGQLDRLDGIIARSQARFAVVDHELASSPVTALHSRPGLRLLPVAEVLAGDPDGWSDPGATHDDIAFLQFTSGSTGHPRGVVITHGNVAHNSAGIHWVRGDQPVVGVNWLPPYHDMGLIGTILHPLHAGEHSILMSPQNFMQRPARWLEAITRYRGTASAAPEFALRMCTAGITDDELALLDLRSWRMLICGAEPVRPTTWAGFVERFAAVGLDSDILSPCYGLAESTLIVTGQRWNERATVREAGRCSVEADLQEASPEARRSLFACGRPIPGQQVAIVDPTLNLLGEGQVGEIMAAGASVGRGYYGDLELSRQTFGIRLPGSDQDWLRTGDLGFIEDGFLFITGRLRDLIKIRGQSLYAQDVEDVAGAAHPALDVDRVAAFSVEDGVEEKLVVIAEVKRAARHVPPGDISLAVRAAIGRAHGVRPSDVALLPPLALPRTSSGKLQRGECRKRWLQGSFNLLTAKPAPP